MNLILQTLIPVDYLVVIYVQIPVPVTSSKITVHYDFQAALQTFYHHSERVRRVLFRNYARSIRHHGRFQKTISKIKNGVNKHSNLHISQHCIKHRSGTFCSIEMRSRRIRMVFADVSHLVLSCAFFVLAC